MVNVNHSGSESMASADFGIPPPHADPGANGHSAFATVNPVSGEAETASSGLDYAPEYGAEMSAAEISSATALVPQAQITAPGAKTFGWLRAAEANQTFLRWAPLLLKVASVGVVVQAIGFAAGILVVRNLPKQEYAFYTLCNTMLSSVLLLADGGISGALTSIGGRIWQDRTRLSQLMRTALRLRWWMASVAVPVVIAVLACLLRRNGASAARIAVLVAIVLAGCGLEMVTRVYVVALRLRSEIRQLQIQSLFSALVRLSLVAAALMVWFNVEVAIVAGVAGFAVQYWMLQSWTRTHLDRDAAPDPGMRSEIVSVVRRQSPHTIYYCLQAQIMVWLISIFGNAERVAEIGALGRLAMLISILGTVMSDVLFPAFARTQEPATVRRRYLQIVCAFSAISALLLCLVALFPGQFLSVLGRQYGHLRTEGVLIAVSSVLGAIAGLTWGLNASRAWVIPAVQFIPVTLLIQVGLIILLDLSTVRGVLLFSIFSTTPSVVWGIGFAMARIRKMQAFA